MLHGGGGWRWRRRRRRGGHQKEHHLPLGQGFRENQRNQDHDSDDPDLNDERDDGRPSTARLKPAAGFDKAVFKHCDSPLLLSDPYGHLDTDCVPFAPSFFGTPCGLPEPERRSKQILPTPTLRRPNANHYHRAIGYLT